MRPDDAPDEIIDVDELMADLRRRVAEKKARGLYGVDAILSEPAPRDEPFAVEELERLRAEAVVSYELTVNPSDKPLVGRAVTIAKQALVRGTSQPGFSLAAQLNAYHASVMTYLTRIARELTDLRAALDEARAEAARTARGLKEMEVDRQRDLGQLEGRVEELAEEVARLRERAGGDTGEP